MAGTTISSSITTGVSLTSSSQNPVTITDAGTINVAGGYASAIYAPFGIVGTVTNAGLVEAPNGYGVFLKAGGSVTNGSTANTTATIAGGVDAVKFGVHGVGTVNNFGTIESTGSSQGAGVVANGSATVSNGSNADTTALISGYFDGVDILHTGATVANFGTITATGTSTIIGSSSFAIYLQDGGDITNGSATDTKAAITGPVFSVEIAHAPGTVINFGTIKTTGPLGRGILLEDGGSVTNNSAGYIGASNRTGIYIAGPTAAMVTNLGTIKAGRTGVSLETGGTVTNGSATDTTASIIGARSGVYIAGLLPAAVSNFGTIAGASGHPGVNLYLGGNLVNGSNADNKALITSGTGGTGAYLGGPSTVSNFGVITGIGASGVSTRGGATIVNGSATDTVAIIDSVGTSGTHSAIYNNIGLTTITNFGTVISSTSSAIHLNQGGGITNGSTADKKASILGAVGHGGIYVASGAVTVTNFATISGGGSALQLHGGGQISNATTGTITTPGGSGIYITGAVGTVVNAGRIVGTGGDGVALVAGGSVTNAASASITGVLDGVLISGGAGTVVNNGSITGTGTAGIGVVLGAGGSVTNTASASIRGASIGVSLPGGGTLKNAGSIIGNSGTAVVFGGTGSNRLGLDPGFGFSGKVIGSASASNTLELASAASTGAISGLGTTFTGFGTTVVDASAQWTVSGANTVATLINNGTLGFGGTGSTLDITASVAPTSSGLFLLGNSATLEVAADTGAGNTMQFLNPAELIVDNAAKFGTHVGTTAYTGPLIESFAAGDSILLKNVLAAGSVLNYSTATGLLQVTGGGTATLLFQNSSLGTGTFQLAPDGSGHALITLVNGGGGS